MGVACDFFQSRKGHLSHELHNIVADQLGSVMSDSFPFRTLNFCVTHETGRGKKSTVPKISGGKSVKRHLW